MNSRGLLAALVATSSLVAASAVPASASSGPDSRVSTEKSLLSQLVDGAVSSTGARKGTQDSVFAVIATDGASEVIQGGTRVMNIRVTNGTSKPVNTLGAKLAADGGLTITDMSRRWVCTPVNSSNPTCRFNGIVGRGETKILKIKVSVPDAEKAGTRNVTVTPFTIGGKKLETHSTRLRVIDAGDPRMAPVVKFMKTSVSSAAVKRTTALQTAYVNQPMSFYASIVNKGYDDLAARDKVTVSQTFGPEVTVSKVTTASGTACAFSDHKWSCVLSSRTAVAPGATLDKIAVVFVPTAASNKLNINPLMVKTPGQAIAEKQSFKVRAVVPADEVKIHTKDLYLAHEGGNSSVQVMLENRGVAVLPAAHVVKMKLPADVTLVSATGTGWTCLAAATKTEFSCAYGKSISPKRNSAVLTVVTKLGKSIGASSDGYDLDFQSPKGWTRHKILVEAAPTATARAGVSKELDGTSIIGLTGEVISTSKRHYESEWVQRCTTQADAKLALCPSHKVVPALTIENPSSPDASAVVPTGSPARTYVFEYRAVTGSLKVPAVVKVRVGVNNVAASGVSAMATAIPTIPADILSALAKYGVSPTGSASKQSSGTVVQSYNLTGTIGKQLAMFGSTGQIQYTPTTDTGSTCAITTFTPNANKLIQKMVGDFYLVATRSPQGCIWNGNTVTGGFISFTLNLFGDKVGFTQVLDPTALPNNFALNTVLKSFKVPLANDEVDFQNVTMTIGYDAAMSNLTIGFTVHTTIMGNDFELGGQVSADISTLLLSVDLVRKQTDPITVGGLTFSNFSVGLGFSWYWGQPAKAFNVIGSGALAFMGQSIAFREIQLDFTAGRVSAVEIDFAMTLNDPGGFSFDGDFSYQWRAAAVPTAKDPNPMPEIAVTAAVEFKADGFVIGTAQDPAMFKWTPACIALSGPVVIPGVLSADVMGTFMINPALGCWDTGWATGASDFFALAPGVIMPSDFRFAAENVDFNLGGVKTTGDFMFGRSYGVPYGKVDMTATLSSRAANASIYVKGEVNPDPTIGIDLNGKATVDIGGYTLNATVEAKVNTNKQYINLAANINVAGTTVNVSGNAGVVKVKGVPVPVMAMAGNAEFKVDGYDLGSGSFSLVESPTDMGLSADVALNLGPLSGDVSASFHVLPNGAIGYAVNGNGKLKWQGNGIDVEIATTDCNDASNCTKIVTPTFSLNGGITVGGKYFGMGWFTFNPDFSFKVSSSGSGETTVEVPDAKAVFIYSYDALLSSDAPYVHLDTDLEAKGYLRWDKKWYKEVDTHDDITFTLDPFYLAVRLCMKDVGCVHFHT